VLVASVCFPYALTQSAEASSPAAKSLVSAATRDAIAGGAVHEVTVTKRSGETLTTVNDVGTSEGRQMITLSDGSIGEILAFDSLKKAYVKGNEIGLKNYFGFPSSAAAKYAGEWMQAIPSDGVWSNIVGYTTLESDFGSNLRVLNPVVSSKIVPLNGVRVYVISGTEAATANAPSMSVRLYVTDQTKPLPVRLIEVAKGVTATINWSNWGESLILQPPQKFVPLP
jgi:hypothetical protein